MLKVIFLDCDGVMNGAKKWRGGRTWIDPEAVSRLNQITEATGAVIVVSSTWRILWDVPTLLLVAGVKAQVIGETPRLPGKDRGDEIARWLRKQAVNKFVILDDDSDMGVLKPMLVKTNWATGLEDCHVRAAIRRLGRRRV